MKFSQDSVNRYIRKISNIFPKVSKASRPSADLHKVCVIKYSPNLNCRRPRLLHNVPPIGGKTLKLCDAYFTRSLPRCGRRLKNLRRLLHPLLAKMWSMLKNSATLIQFPLAEAWSMFLQFFFMIRPAANQIGIFTNFSGKSPFFGHFRALN